MTVTNAQLDELAGHMASLIADVAVGTGTTEATATDTSLESELLRKAASTSDGATGEKTYIMRLLSSEANGSDISEVGVFDSDGTMYGRITFDGISKTSDFEIQFEITLTHGNK